MALQTSPAGSGGAMSDIFEEVFGDVPVAHWVHECDTRTQALALLYACFSDLNCGAIGTPTEWGFHREAP